MMKKTFLTLLCMLLAVCFLPLNALAGLYQGDVVYITARSPVNVRSQADADSRMVGEVTPENTYTLLDRVGDWYYIQFRHDIRGYIPTRYAQVQTGIIWDDNHPGELDAVVRNTHYNALNVRSEADLDSRVIDSIPPDSTFPFYGTEDGWHRIWIDGRYGFVAANRTTVEITDTWDIIGGPSTAKGSEPCTECESTGDCYTCRNRGYVFGAVEQDYVDCPTCCGLAYCGACGGDGWR